MVMSVDPETDMRLCPDAPWAAMKAELICCADCNARRKRYIPSFERPMSDGPHDQQRNTVWLVSGAKVFFCCE